MSNGTLDTAHSKNVSTSSQVGTGIYCLKITATVTNANATVDTGNDGGQFGSASVVLGGEDPSNYIGTLCPSGDNAIVGVSTTSGSNANYSTWSDFN